MALEWYPWFVEFYQGVTQLIREERSGLVHLKWKIGKHILDFKQDPRENRILTDETEAPIVQKLLKLLSKKLT